MTGVLTDLEEATKRATRAGELFTDRGAGAEWSEAYERWMRARASVGDAFALSLGYTATGWDLATWERHHRDRRRAR